MGYVLGFFSLLTLGTVSGCGQSRALSPEATLIQQQFDAYNRHDARAMAQAFAPVFYRGTLGDTLTPVPRDTLASTMAARAGLP